MRDGVRQGTPALRLLVPAKLTFMDLQAIHVHGENDYEV
jgi:hypothetical protein